jgi:outer membrane receptor protein involved in Fe transport
VLTQQDIFSTANISAGVRLNHHSLYGNEVAPQIGFALRVDNATTIKASSGKGFQSPTIRELYLFPLLSGAGEMRITGGPAFLLQPYSVAYCPPLTEHDVINTGSDTLRYIWLVAKARQ